MLCSQLSLFCFHPSDTLPDRMAFYDPENMTDTHFLCQDGDMDGTGQKAFLVHAGQCLMSTLGSVPPPPAPAPPQLWDSIYLLLCSGHIHLQGSCLLLLSSPGQWLLSLAWTRESDPCRPHWWFWLLHPSLAFASVVVVVRPSSRYLAIGKKKPKQLAIYVPKAAA